MISLMSQSFCPCESLKEFTNQAEGAGAIVSFTGLVRERSLAGDVKELYLQAYSPMTENGIRSAHEVAIGRWNLQSAQIIHRIGNMHPGEPIVFVAAASTHRRAAFEAADYLMDYLKTEAIFWKKETTEHGAKWIEPRCQDYTDASRWNGLKGVTNGVR